MGAPLLEQLDRAQLQGALHATGRASLHSPGASLSLGGNPNVNALNDSCNRMYL
jgi:hypothetical protein